MMMAKFHMYVFGVPDEGERKFWVESIFEEILVQNFPKMTKDMKPWIQKYCEPQKTVQYIQTKWHLSIEYKYLKPETKIKKS